MNQLLVTLCSVWLILATVMAPVPSHAAETFDSSDVSWNLEKNHRHRHSHDVIVNASMTLSPVVRKILWSGVQGCRHEVPRKSPEDTTDDLLPLSSTCPWNWVINFDPRRTPSTLMVANCTCSDCLSAGSQGHRCQPVHYFRPVVYFKGTKQEITRLYRLPVGCTCERHATS